MANTSAPRGLVPLRTLSGGTIVTNPYSIAADYTTAIYRGDVVELTGTGKNIAKSAAANVDNVGVFAGCYYTDATGKPVFSKYWPGVSDSKTNIVALVWDDPNIVWEVQADGCVAGEVGVVCDWNVGAGNTASGLSGLYAVVSGTSATSGGSLKVMGLVDRPDNAYGSYAKIEALLIEHVNNSTVSGVGGI
jgi:hypothetical protein